MSFPFDGIKSCLFFIGLVMVIGATAGCAPEQKAALSPLDSSTLSGQRALEETAALLEKGPRVSGSAAMPEIAAYLQGRLAALGWETAIDEFEDETPLGPVTFRNIVGILPGARQDLILIGAHYDTKYGISDNFVGANDAASAVALGLELARVLAAHPQPRPEFRIAFFDGEECRVQYGPRDGFHGSRRMASEVSREGRRADVRAVIVLDMIGDRDLSVGIPRNSSPALITMAFSAADKLGVRPQFALYSKALWDDHIAFLNRGMPAIDLIDFKYGSKPGLNDYWHTEKDTIDKISAESLETVGRVTLELINELQEKM